MLKKLSPIFALLWFVTPLSAQYCGNSGPGQCTPQGNYTQPGFYPSSAQLPPFDNNVYVDTVIQVKVPSNLSGYVIDSMSIDYITNLPPGLCWSCNQASNTIPGNGVGCIRIMGTPCGATGQYYLNMHVYLGVQTFNFPLPYYGYSIGLAYMMRLKNPLDTIRPVDTTQTFSNPIIAYGGTCTAVTPLVISNTTIQPVCVGTSVTLNAVIGGGVVPYTYAWQNTGANLSCNSCSSPTVTITQNSTFILAVTDYAGTVKRDTINYQVVPSPVYTISSLDGICVGDTVIVSGAPVPSQIIWEKRGVPFDTVPCGYGAQLSIGTVSTSFDYANAVFVDKKGYVYVADGYTNRVIKFPPGSNTSSTGTIVAGYDMGSALNQLNNPQDVYVDDNGYIYVSDYGNNRVMKFPPNSDSSTLGTIAAGGNALTTALNSFQPSGICLDLSGNLYVCDWGNYRILEFPPNSNGTTNGVIVAGGNGSGQAANQFSIPNYIRVDKQGTMYISDYNNARIQEFPAGSNQNTNGITFAGHGSTGNSTVTTPSAICLDASGNLYVACYNTGLIMKFPPNSVAHTSAIAVISPGLQAYGVALDTAQNVYVTYNQGTVENVVEFAATINNSLTMDSLLGYSALVTGYTGCVDTTGALTPTNVVQNQTLVVNVSQNNVCAGSSVTFTAAASVTGPGSLYQWFKNGVPVGINNTTYTTTAVQNFDSVWCTVSILGACVAPTVATSNVVHMVTYIPSVLLPSIATTCQGSSLSVSGTVNDIGINPGYVWTRNSQPFGANSDTVTSSAFNNLDTLRLTVNYNVCGNSGSLTSNFTVVTVNPVPVVTVAPIEACSDTLAVTGADGSNSIVWKYNGNTVATNYAQPGNYMSNGVIAAGGNGYGTGNAQFRYPYQIAIGNDDEIYVSDYDRVMRFVPNSTINTGGQMVAQLYGSNFVGMCVDNHNHVFTADQSHWAEKFYITADTGIQSISFEQFTGGTQNDGWYYETASSTGVATDRLGNVYIADGGNDVVWKYGPNAGTSAFPMAAVGRVGHPGDSVTQFNGVAQIYVDTAYNLYCLDQGNNRVVMYNAASQPKIIAGSALNNPIAGVMGFGLDAGGNLYVTTTGNYVKKFPAGSDSTTVPTIVAGTGIAGSAPNQFNYPSSIVFDSKGNMYVLDEVNYRVMKYYPYVDTVYSPGQTGTYSAIITTQYGCLATAGPVNFTAPVTQSLNITASQNNVCVNTPVTFTATALAGGTDSVYQWYKNGVAVGTNSSTYISTVQNFDSIWCSLSIGVCTAPVLATSNVVHMSVSSYPSVNIANSGLTLCNGSTLTLIGHNTNLGPSPVFTWKQNNVVVGGNSDTLITNAFLNSDSFQLFVQCTNACISSPDTFSNKVAITLYPATTVSLTNSGGACPDTLMVAGASSAASIQWYRNGVPVQITYPTVIGPGRTVAGVTGDTGSTEDKFSAPYSVAINSLDQYLTVSDVGNERVLMFYDPPYGYAGVRGTIAFGIQQNDPLPIKGVFSPRVGLIYMADSAQNIVYAVSGIGGTIYHEAQSSLSGPSALYISNTINSDTLYITDSGNNRVAKSIGGTITTFSGGNGAGAGATQLNNPRGIAAWGDTLIAVSDFNNNRVLAYGLHSNSSTPGITIAGGGGIGSALNQLNQPLGLCTDISGNLYIADAGNNRVLELVYGSSTPVIVAGGHGAGPGANQLNYPTGVCFDGFGNLYIADMRNNRVQMWGPTRTLTTDTTFVPTQPGTYYAVVTTQGGCSVLTTDSIVIAPVGPATVTIWAATDTVCNASSVTVTPHPTYGGAPVYQWMINDSLVATNQSSFTTSGLINGDTLSVVMTSNSGCATSLIAQSNNIVFTVLANTIASLSLGVSPGDTICAGTSVTITVTAANAGTNPAYTWYINDTMAGTGSTLTRSNFINNERARAMVVSDAVCPLPATVSDSVIVTVNPVLSSAYSHSICAGQTYNFNGHLLSANSTYYDTLTSVITGCDSIVTLTLNTIQPLGDTLVKLICAGSAYNFNGTVLTAAGTYRDTLTSANTGCDSITVLTLSLIQPVTTNSTAQVCPGGLYNFYGNHVAAPGVYNDTLASVVTGCDSIIHLTLSVIPVVTVYDTQSVCAGHTYNFNGTPLSTAGTYRDTLTSTITGCDSVVVLTLSIGNIITSAYSHAICAGSGYLFNGVQLTHGGTYMDTFTVAGGCDSVVTLTLTVIPAPVTILNDSICTGGSYNFNGHQLTQAGTYTDTLTTLAGCDSIVTLSLVVDTTPVISTLPDTTICIGNSIQLAATSPGSSIAWRGGYSNMQNVTINQNIRFIVIATSLSSVCRASDTITVTSLQAVGTMLNTDTTICISDILTLTAHNGVSFNWAGSVSGNISTDSVYLYTITGNQQISVRITDAHGCVATDSFAVTVLPQVVWPGDANDDSVVNNFDILAIGIAYGSTGPARPNASTVWQPQCTYAWAGSFGNGVNYAQADCNGDGVIDDADTLVVLANYGLTKSLNQFSRAGNINLQVVTDRNNYAPGDTVTGYLLLGDSVNGANNIYGLAYTIGVCNAVKPNTFNISQSASWLIPTGNRLEFMRPAGTGGFEMAQSRISHTNTSGYGKIAAFSYIVNTGVTDGTACTIDVTNVLCVNSQNDTIGVNAISDTVILGNRVNNISTVENAEIKVYPNPTTGLVIVEVSGTLSGEIRAEVYDELGQKALVRNLTDATTVINLSPFASGIYILKVAESGNTLLVKRICLTR